MTNALPKKKWKLKTRVLEFGEIPHVMGIVNVTPDSFSDGGKFTDHAAAVAHGLKLVEDGADILDIGGESTRPYSDPVSNDEELQRVIPVIRQLAKATDIPISIDTSKASVADAALLDGAEIINDVTGLQGDPQMIDIARQSGAGICAMHMQGTPQSMQDHPSYHSVVEDILAYLIERRDGLLEQGIDPLKICLDPGIGFGKTHEHNLQLLHEINRFHETGCPILAGHSRKGFIKKFSQDDSTTCLAGTLAVSLLLARSQIQVIRVHDVLETQQALRMQHAVDR